MHARHHQVAIIAALAAAAVLPFPAAAQGILGRVKNKVADAAGKKAGDKAADKAGAENAGGPRFGGDDLEITAARLDQFLRGVEADTAEAYRRVRDSIAADREYQAAMRKYEADKKEYDRKVPQAQADAAKFQQDMMAYQQCTQSNRGYQQSNARTMAMMQKVQGMSEAERNAFVRKLEDLMKRADAAHKRGDDRTAKVLTDSANALMGVDPQKQATAGREMSKCGKPPEMPAQLAQMGGAEPQQPERRAVLPPQDSIGAWYARRDTIAARAAGLTVRQYVVMRERIASYYTLIDLPDNDKNKAYYTRKFTPAEREALAARKARLLAYRDVIRPLGNGLPWWHNSRQR